MVTSGSQWSVDYVHGFENSVTGASAFNAFTGGVPAGNETIRLYENSVGVAYAYQF